MKKNIKIKIKKNIVFIIGFIIGIIIASTSVYAAVTIQASQINHLDTNLQAKIDSLTANIKETYTGNVEQMSIAVIESDDISQVTSEINYPYIDSWKWKDYYEELPDDFSENYFNWDNIHECTLGVCLEPSTGSVNYIRNADLSIVQPDDIIKSGTYYVSSYLDDNPGSSDTGTINQYGFYFKKWYVVEDPMGNGECDDEVIMFFEDGSIKVGFYINGEITDVFSQPAGFYTYLNGQILLDGELAYSVQANGKELFEHIDYDKVYTLLEWNQINEYGFYFDKTYVGTFQSEDYIFIFKENETIDVYIDGLFNSTLTGEYKNNKITIIDLDLTGTISNNGKEINIADLGATLTLSDNPVFCELAFDKTYKHVGDDDETIYIFHTDGSYYWYWHSNTGLSNSLNSNPGLVKYKNNKILNALDNSVGFEIKNNGKELIDSSGNIFVLIE